MSSRVLVVDDEQDLCLALRLYLERMGYQVQVHHSAAEVRIALKSGKLDADLAMVDQQIGAECGTTLAELLLKKLPALRVIIMSGLPLEPEELPKGNKSRVRFLQKPFRSSDVSASITELLRNR